VWMCVVVQVGVLRKALQQLSTMGLGGDSAVPAPHAAQQPSLFDRAKVLTAIDPPTRGKHAVALVWGGGTGGVGLTVAVHACMHLAAGPIGPYPGACTARRGPREGDEGATPPLQSRPAWLCRPHASCPHCCSRLACCVDMASWCCLLVLVGAGGREPGAACAGGRGGATSGEGSSDRTLPRPPTRGKDKD
jgi:hypothetical protein